MHCSRHSRVHGEETCKSVICLLLWKNINISKRRKDSIMTIIIHYSALEISTQSPFFLWLSTFLPSPYAILKQILGYSFMNNILSCISLRYSLTITTMSLPHLPPKKQLTTLIIWATFCLNENHRGPLFQTKLLLCAPADQTKLQMKSHPLKFHITKLRAKLFI
jgi:hypothetical protein